MFIFSISSLMTIVIKLPNLHDKWLLSLKIFLKNLLKFGYCCFFFGPLGTVIVEMKLDVQYSEKVFLGNFQYPNQKQTGDNQERELVSVQDCVT